MVSAQDHLLCITEDPIEGAAAGRRLAERVVAAAGSGGVPLHQVAFWRHSRDADLDPRDMSYRLELMTGVVKLMSSYCASRCVCPGSSVFVATHFSIEANMIVISGSFEK